MKEKVIPTQITEKELWDEFRAGKEGAFEKVYVLVIEDLYSYGFHLVRDKALVEDEIHNLFVYLYDKRQNLGQTSSIKFYLFRALRRRIMLAKELTDQYVSTETVSDFTEFSLSASAESAMIDADGENERRAQVQKLLNTLPKRQKEVLYLSFFEEFSHKQIADLMQIEVETVYNLLYRALSKLREYKNFLLLLLIPLLK